MRKPDKSKRSAKDQLKKDEKIREWKIEGVKGEGWQSLWQIIVAKWRWAVKTDNSINYRLGTSRPIVIDVDAERANLGQQ